ncbi:proenkephalin-A-like [Synchiropus splendidus]|uniref:proenkephalin-A-like n=1 Tax=Synchiropus splendidus TaxID=270530 RepID=UPI00237DFA49|nr:proenkephalin-A-like [Synchiropus splendidus]XP_053739126.1 proenkephalin-A-like [Synchiropus splendidus]
MAVTHGSCVWMMLVSACLSLVAGSDCGKECALCVYQLLGQESRISALTCSLECDGMLDSQKFRLCQEILMGEEDTNPLNESPHQQQGEEASSSVTTDGQESTLSEHQLTKKYGGFMKRYGGFMARRSTPGEPPESPGNQDEEENIRLEILKILNSATERNGEGGGQAGEAAKRYGGFMRRADGNAAQSDLLEAVLGRGLKKRYGGFMRRVGRPEWLVDSSKNGGVLKRAWENGSELQKRYGGFMD